MSIRHALLALLAETPQHGLHLKQGFEQHTGELWPLNVGQVYSTLQRLERDELVVGDADGSDARQRLYQLTEQGRDELDRWLNATAYDPTPPRNELVIKVLVAVAIPDVDTIAVIDRHRRQILEAMQQLTRTKMHDHGLASMLVADAELFRLEGAIRWLDMAESRIDRGDRVELRSDLSSDAPAPDAAEKRVDR